MIKSPLRYPGGKSKAVKFLVPLLRKGKELREPFVGGGSVWITALQELNYDKIWINDLNYSLSCFWKQALYNNANLIEKIRVYHSIKEPSLYNKMIEVKANSELEEAVRFFVLKRITFSGVTESGGYSRQAHLKRFTDTSIERLSKLDAFKCSNIKVTDEDFETSILAPGEDVMIFLDPPYFSAEKSKLYGKNGDLHEGFDHVRLFNTLEKCPHNWMMTYDNSTYIKNLYKDYYIYEWSLQYGMTNKTTEKNNELLISNYKIDILENV